MVLLVWTYLADLCDLPTCLLTCSAENQTGEFETISPPKFPYDMTCHALSLASNLLTIHSLQWQLEGTMATTPKKWLTGIN